jgi:hypothetical protein
LNQKNSNRFKSLFMGSDFYSGGKVLERIKYGDGMELLITPAPLSLPPKTGEGKSIEK